MEVLTEATLGIHGDEKEAGLPEAIQEAGEALALSPQGRLLLVVDIPSEGESAGEEGREGEDNQENIEPMELTPSGRKRLHPLESDDSDADIGRKKVTRDYHSCQQECFNNALDAKQTQSRRPKRAAAKSAAERGKARKRAKRIMDSDDSGWPTSPPSTLSLHYSPSLPSPPLPSPPLPSPPLRG